MQAHSPRRGQHGPRRGPKLSHAHSPRRGQHSPRKGPSRSRMRISIAHATLLVWSHSRCGPRVLLTGLTAGVALGCSSLPVLLAAWLPSSLAHPAHAPRAHPHDLLHACTRRQTARRSRSMQEPAPPPMVHAQVAAPSAAQRSNARKWRPQAPPLKTPRDPCESGRRRKA